jgi:hypothetical protein
MNIEYDEYNQPLVGVIDISDDGYSSMSLQPTYYYDKEVPGYGYVDSLYVDPEERLYPFRDLTSQIYYLWNNFEPEQKTYVKTKFGSFHPLDDMFYDLNYSYDWDNLFRFWNMDSNYIDNNRQLNNDGLVLLVSLQKYMNEIADEKLRELVKKECCSNDKHLARAIWIEAERKVRNIKKKENLTPAEIAAIKNKFKELSSSSTDPNNKEIYKIYNYMWKCYERKKTTSKNSFQIENFLKIVLRDGIKHASENYKKYLLLKKKYLDKKTLKKL